MNPERRTEPSAPLASVQNVLAPAPAPARSALSDLEPSRVTDAELEAVLAMLRGH